MLKWRSIVHHGTFEEERRTFASVWSWIKCSI